MSGIKVPTGRTEWPSPEKPTPAPGCVFEQEDNPHAGNCEASWWWVEYRVEEQKK